MAKGDVTWFDAGLKALGDKEVDLGGGQIKLGLITSAVTPAADTAGPCWGSGGSTNLSSSQVSTAGSEYTGPITLGSQSWADVSGVMTFDAADVSLAEDGSGFTDARWGILYDDGATNKNAIGFLDLGADTSIAAASLDINWNADGILTLARE